MVWIFIHSPELIWQRSRKHSSWPVSVTCISFDFCGRTYISSVFQIPIRWSNNLDSKQISHRIHETGKFTTNLSLKKQQFMYVNIPSVPWILRVWKWTQAAFDPQHSIQRDRSTKISGMDQSLLQSSTWPYKMDNSDWDHFTFFWLGNCFLLFFESLRLILYHIVDIFW